ncbi:uncharacterized protein TNCV_1560551 [Trichonephila clavipes]|nr:uncharacterized protein TNCV_1560551 [Trichonephila clavipes]
MPNISFHEGIPSNLHQYSDALIVIDDLMGELGNDPQLTKLFVKFSHHKNLSLIFVVQNIFQKGKEIREISLNAHYLVLFKNRRDQSQITHLGHQLYPRKEKFFQECYADATSKPYGYLLIDLKPETDESLRVHTGSNIAFLVNDFLRNQKSAPEGKYVFLRALNDVNLPKNLDVN